MKKKKHGKWKYILIAIIVIFAISIYSDEGGNESAEKETHTMVEASPKPTPNPLEKVAGKYKRTALESLEGGSDNAIADAVGGFVGGAIDLFGGEVILTLDPDGTGLLDYSGLGIFAGHNEDITWGPDNTIHILFEDATWQYEGKTLYIDTPTTHLEFVRVN